MLGIAVSDPEKHGTSSSLPQNHFVDFKVRTCTDEPRFATRPEFFVRRRYRDFVWLRAQLVASFPGAIVPPLPQTDSLVKDDRFSTKFIQRRQAGLELFLRRVAVHGQLSTSSDLLTFLEAKVWELQTAKNSSVRSWTADLLDSTESSMKRAAGIFRSKVPDDDGVEKLRAFASEYYAVVSAAEAAHLSNVNTLGDAAADLSHLGPAVDLLSQSETELSLPFTHMATALTELNELYLKRVQAEHVSG